MVAQSQHVFLTVICRIKCNVPGQVVTMMVPVILKSHWPSLMPSPARQQNFNTFPQQLPFSVTHTEIKMAVQKQTLSQTKAQRQIGNVL